MGVRLRSRGARSVAALGAASLLLVSAFVATAAGSRSTLRTTGGIWSSTLATSSVSTTIYVSAVDCRRVGAGQVQGQRSGIELFGGYRSHGSTVHPFDFAGFYAYCSGHRAAYRAEFLISEPGTGLLRFVPAGFPVAPGDPLRIAVSRHGAHLTLTISDLNTHRSATAGGPSLGLGYGWAAGVLPLYGGPSGQPYVRGSVPLVEEYTPTGGPNTIPGPAPFAPVVFSNFHANGRRLNSRGNAIQSTTWHGTTGSGARVTHVRNGAFVATGRLRPPKLGRSADVTPVSGSSLIEVPGSHRFVHLGKGLQIPNDSEIDTRHGAVQITLGLPHGRTETGVFYDGRFKLHQDGTTGATTATLTGGDETVCPAAGGTAARAPGSAARASGVASAAKAKAKHKPKKIRSLWANAHGNFTTKGSGGAAAVLGTKWYTEDTCQGTYFRVVRDKIKVTAYYPHLHTVVVTAGHSYFAPSGAPIIQVAPVTSTGGRYNVHVSGAYSLVVVSSARPQYVNAAVAPQPPSGGDYLLDPDGSVNGIPRWRIVFHITPSIGHFQDWNVGVRVGGTLYVVKLRVS